MTDIKSLLEDFCLTTAEIIYHLPDHPHILQSYIWQDYDRYPDFPKLYRFLSFWSRSLDGQLHSVHISVAGHLIFPKYSFAKDEFYIN